MQLYTTIAGPDARTNRRKGIYRQALIAERWANAGFFGRMMMRVGI